MSHISTCTRLIAAVRVANPATQGHHNRLHVMPDRFLRSTSLAFFWLLLDGLSFNPSKESRTLDYFIIGLFRILWSLHVLLMLTNEST